MSSNSAPMLMAEQLDQMGGEQLRRKIEHGRESRVTQQKHQRDCSSRTREARKTMRFCRRQRAAKSILSFSNRYPLRAISWPPSAVWRSPTRGGHRGQ